MSKGTPAHGRKTGKKTHLRCRRCGHKTYHFQKKRCSHCGFPDKKLRKYHWAVRWFGKRRK